MLICHVCIILAQFPISSRACSTENPYQPQTTWFWRLNSWGCMEVLSGARRGRGSSGPFLPFCVPLISSSVRSVASLITNCAACFPEFCEPPEQIHQSWGGACSWHLKGAAVGSQPSALGVAVSRSAEPDCTESEDASWCLEEKPPASEITEVFCVGCGLTAKGDSPL